MEIAETRGSLSQHDEENKIARMYGALEDRMARVAKPQKSFARSVLRHRVHPSFRTQQVAAGATIAHGPDATKRLEADLRHNENMEAIVPPELTQKTREQ
eukprot:1077342-Amphidinium_carterae.1